ncbi:MAG: hypothetical protein Q8K96_03500 [Rubrivivax sp.]|nr:hypothetical protein [Rubrivivax sp.]
MSLFQPTRSNDAGALMRLSEFQRHHGEPVPAEDASAGSTRLTSLNPSLMQDLLRFEGEHRPGEGLDALEVLAAALRHGRDLRVHLQLNYRVIPLTVWPAERQMHSPLPLNQLLELRLPDLQVLRVEPAPQRDEPAPAGQPQPPQTPLHLLPLGPLLWELALRGAREALLPEIAGVATYRVAPGCDLRALDLCGSLATAVARLSLQSSALGEIAGWPGFDRERAMRMLNGLYLQSALIISRSNPAALDDA